MKIARGSAWIDETARANAEHAEQGVLFSLCEVLYDDWRRALGEIMCFEDDGPTYAFAFIPTSKTRFTSKRLGAFAIPEHARKAVCRALEARHEQA